MSDEVEARKRAAASGWLGQPQPKRERQMGIPARRAVRAARLAREAEKENNPLPARRS